jgi:hypothetical protein
MQSPNSNPSRRPAPGRPQSTQPASDDRRAGPPPTPASPVATYWLSIRLADAIPPERITEIKAEATDAVAQEGGDESALRRQIAQRIDQELDQSHGDCWLRDEEVARIVVSALHSGHGRRYTLRAWTLLPNHAQVVFTVADGVDAGTVVRDWRRDTTTQINLATGRGAIDLWEKSHYLRPCADDAEVMRRIRSIDFRAVNANLCRRPRDWKWCSSHQNAPASPTPRSSSPNPTPAPAPAPTRNTPPPTGRPRPQSGADF